MIPLVSVLMPVYNGEKYLSEAVESILNQTLMDFEFIICNDASTDRSREIIQGFNDKRIVFIENEENKGIVFTRNRLLLLAKGRFLSIMDCDDIALPRKLEKQIAFMKKHDDCGLCGTWVKKIDHNCNVTGHIQMPVLDEDIRTNLLFQSSFVQSSVVIKKKDLGNLLYNVDFPVAEDYDLWERLAHETKMYNIPQYLLLYRWHETNISQQKEQLMQERRNLIIYRQLKNKFVIKDNELMRHIEIGNLVSFRETPIEQTLKESELWFISLIRQNLLHKYYNPIQFQCFIWYRWFFYCCFHKRYYRACFPKFGTINLFVICRLIYLIGNKILGKMK